MVYQRKSRMTVWQQQKLLEPCVAGPTARAAAMLVGVQANTAIRFYQRLRRLIASKVERDELSGEVEADERYFGGGRKGRRGRGAAGNVPVVGLFKRGGKGSTAMIPNAQASTLIPMIREKVLPDSLVETDSFHVDEVLDVSDFHPRRGNHSHVFVSTRGHHINGLENFWSQAKRHLRRFNGIPQDSFYWLLKECDGRFNGGGHTALFHQLKAWYRAAINRS